MANSRKAESFFSRNRWWIIATAIVAAVVLLAAFNSMRGDIVPIHAVRVSRGTIRSVVSTNGKAEPLQNFEAHAPVATTVQRVLVKEGDRVKRGQLLVQLDDADARSASAKALAQVRSSEADLSAVAHGGTQEEVLTTDAQLVKARADLETAQRNLDALQRLVKQGAATPGEVKDAQAQLQTAQANVNLLEQKLKDRYSKPEVAKVEAQKSGAQAAYQAAQDIVNKSNIRAPFDGVVYSLPVRAGTYVNPGDLLLQEADLRRVRVRAYVDEPDVGKLVPQQAVEVTWDAIPGRSWRGTLVTIPAAVKLYGTRNVGEITTELDNPDFKLLPNVNVTVQVITAEHHDVVVAPREAVRMDGATPYVYRVVDDELRKQPVQTSIANLTQVEVTKGLSDNEVIALSPLNNKPMRDGQAVRVVF